MILEKSIVENLTSIYSNEGIERGGFLTKNELIEVENDHPNKIEGFSFKIEDLERLEDEEVVATFHTHPNGKSNLSKEDCVAFKNWSNLLHFIVGKDGISCYKVTDRNTIVIEDIDVCKN
jgi:proteasome lid subunit RPN8/RPN11